MTDTQRTILNALPPGSGSGAEASVADVARWAVPMDTAGLGENVATIATQLEQLRPLTQQQAESAAEVVQGAIPPVTPGLGEEIATIASQLEQLRALTQRQAESVAKNTQAVAQNTASQTQGGVASAAGNVAKTAAKTLGGALSVVPLVSALVGVFKRDKPEPPPLQTYTLPPSIQFQGAWPAGGSQGIVGVDYGQDGLPRAVTPGTQNHAPSVTVQVQAMDSRSFMDHSDEIARAVREALLNAHSLGDVMSEL